MRLILMNSSYGIFLLEEINSVLPHLENHPDTDCFFHCFYLLFIAGVGENIYQVAVVSCVDMQTEDKHCCKEDFNCTLHWKVMSILASLNRHGNQQRPSIVFSVNSF